MSADERWSALLERLAATGRLSVEDAAREFEVSQATIRRDFEELAHQQLLVRTRGGAVPNRVALDLPLRYKSLRHAAEKQRIAAAAAAMVPAGAIVGLNGGTTTTEVARALATHPDLHGDGARLTIVTNALNIANELAIRPHIKLVVSGGVARPKSYELSGPLAEALLAGVSLDIAFLGVDGLDLARGASTHDEAEASVNHLMASRAQRVVVVADSSKLSGRAFARICTLAEIDAVITDDGASSKVVQQLREAKVEVVIA